MNSSRFLIILLFLISSFSYSQYTTENYARVLYPEVETGWYNEWLEHTDNKPYLPEAVERLKKWENPFLKYPGPGAMHEDSGSTDVSNFGGPTPDNVEVQYFQVRAKGGNFSGMCPLYMFLNDSTMVTLSFGRAETELLILDVKDTIKILELYEVPGRGSTAMELAGKKGRDKIFKNTAGGAYSYLSANDEVIVPGADNTILIIPIRNRSFDYNNIKIIHLEEQIGGGDLLDKHITKKDRLNLLTAVMPDKHGNIWFTSRYGVVGVIHHEDLYKPNQPRVYATFIGFFAAEEKMEQVFEITLTSNEKEILKERRMSNLSPELREKFRENFLLNDKAAEEIQNSFSVSEDGVYIVSNLALYKFHFNEDTKRIEIDPKWRPNYKKGELIYDNDFSVKPGHLNNGSGTTPTLMDNRFVAIGDNAPNQINICIFDQETGELLTKEKLFKPNASACENSIVAYKDSYMVANTYGYTDPFMINNTAGGLNRFDYSNGKFVRKENWPTDPTFDPKTATPKMSTKSGMMFVYNRHKPKDDAYPQWQLTAVDFRTGKQVYYIRPGFEKGGFDDNISFITKGGSLGNKDYDLKVFNNLWGTYAFGPQDDIYIAGYRGFLIFRNKESSK